MAHCEAAAEAHLAESQPHPNPNPSPNPSPNPTLTLTLTSTLTLTLILTKAHLAESGLERELGVAWFAMRGFDVHLLAVGGPMRKK